METIKLTLIFCDGRPIDLLETEFWNENMEDAPYDWDQTEVITVPLKEWNEDEICFHNYKKYVK